MKSNISVKRIPVDLSVFETGRISGTVHWTQSLSDNTKATMLAFAFMLASVPFWLWLLETGNHIMTRY